MDDQAQTEERLSEVADALAAVRRMIHGESDPDRHDHDLPPRVVVESQWGRVCLSDAGVSIDGGKPIAWGGPR